MKARLNRILAGLALSGSSAAALAQVPPGVGLDLTAAAVGATNAIPVGGPLATLLVSGVLAAAGLWTLRRSRGHGAAVLLGGALVLSAGMAPMAPSRAAAYMNMVFFGDDTPMPFAGLPSHAPGCSGNVEEDGLVMFSNGGTRSMTIRNIYTSGDTVTLVAPRTLPASEPTCEVGQSLPPNQSCSVQVRVQLECVEV